MEKVNFFASQVSIGGNQEGGSCVDRIITVNKLANKLDINYQENKFHDHRLISEKDW